jgi:MFS family permease
VCTAGFWLRAGHGETSLYGLHVWTGLIAAIVVVQLWLLVADAFDPALAKRAFAVIGAGGLIGATFGSALAGALLRGVGPRDLVLVASGLMALSGIVPALAWHGSTLPEPRPSRRPHAEPERDDGRPGRCPDRPDRAPHRRAERQRHRARGIGCALVAGAADRQLDRRGQPGPARDAAKAEPLAG